MNRALSIIALSTAVPALASTYTVPAGSSASAIQAIVNSAGAAPGNTVAFSPGAYSLKTTVNLPCSNGTVYTGPVLGPQQVIYSSAGVMSIANLPTAIFNIS